MGRASDGHDAPYVRSPITADRFWNLAKNYFLARACYAWFQLLGHAPWHAQQNNCKNPEQFLLIKLQEFAFGVLGPRIFCSRSCNYNENINAQKNLTLLPILLPRESTNVGII